MLRDGRQLLPLIPTLFLVRVECNTSHCVIITYHDEKLFSLPTGHYVIPTLSCRHDAVRYVTVIDEWPI